MSPTVERDEQYARQRYTMGHLAAAEIVCREILDRDSGNVVALNLLGMIAAQVGMHAHARDHFSEALAANPARIEARNNLAALAAMHPAASAGAAQTDRYLVIKAWGFGFWSDVSQVLGALLLSECTGRIPVVHWGHNSLFGDATGGNAFCHYFEPITAVALEDVAKVAGNEVFPRKWGQRSLFDEEVNKWGGSHSRMAALYFLARPEKVAVFDFFTGAIDVAPWLPADHPMHGKPLPDIYRYLIDKYLKPRESVVAACDAFHRDHLAGGSFAAIHLRGSDKVHEDEQSELTNRANIAALETIDASRPILVLTDDDRLAQQLRSVYGPRVVMTDSQRTSNTTGVHYLREHDRVRLGLEVLLDTYLALRASTFLGNGRSNVSAFIALLKDWQAGDCTLRGPSLLMERNLALHVPS